MNENDHKTTEAPPTVPEARGRGNKKVVFGVVAVVALFGMAALAWILWPRQEGKPVPAPRSVSFESSSTRPSASTGDQKLTLTDEQLRTAGLKIETVGERPSTEAMSQMTTGIVQPNTYKETPVMSLVSGIVRSVGPELGQKVTRGQQVAVVFSNELADTQSKYLAAIAALDEHHKHHARTMKLVEIGAASREDLEMANTKLRDAEADVANLRQKLLLLGVSSQRINSLSSTSQVSSEVSVAAPSSGTVTNRSVNPGEVIEANKELMRVTDLSTVWIVGQIYEKDLAKIHVGSGANVTSETYPNRTFRGRVSYVDPKIDQATRTDQVRIELANPGQMFKIGMYVNVGFATLETAEKTLPTIPKDAVQTIGNQQFVFLATVRPSEFLLRPVQLGSETKGFYPVIEGINVGDRIVTQGSFMLRAEWLKTHPIQ